MKTAAPKKWDFSTGEKLVIDSLPGLSVINERFGLNLSSSMSRILKEAVQFKAIESKNLSFGDWNQFLKSQSPLCYGIVRFESLKQPGFIVVDGQCLDYLTDRYMGGTQKIQANRSSVAIIDERMARRFLVETIDSMEKSWQPLLEMEISLRGTEVESGFVQTLPPSEICYVTRYELNVDGSQGGFWVVIPRAGLSRIRDKICGLHMIVQNGSEEDQNKISESLEKTTVSMTAILGEAQIVMEDLLNLTAGDVIQLEGPNDGTVSVNVEGKEKFHGEVGTVKGQKAIKITDVS
jgi:flagellar motor switch protein FliM